MKPRIVFMGTPDFAVPSLEILLENGYPVVGVVTATDKMGGRGGKQILESAVKKCAVQHNIPVLQPPNLKADVFVEELRALKADLQIVVAFRMLPVVVWDMPPLGTFNLHGSLLPKYRGAAPINWAVIRGEEVTGCTTFFLQHAIDTGDILLQRSMPIGPNETAGDVHDRMMHLGADAVLETVQMIEKGKYDVHKQDDSKATSAPKLHREMCEINFAQDVQNVHNFIRGLSPWPAAWTRLNGKQLKIIRTRISSRVKDSDVPVGTLYTDGEDRLEVACIGGWLQIDSLQLAGRKRMKTDVFLRGNKLEDGQKLGA